jgi:hypothetical protein
MRMRQLGSGHTVMYFAPTEVHNKILDISKQRNDQKPRKIEAMDVLQWVIGETCQNIRDSVPLWTTQGLGYLKRQAAWNNYWAPVSGFERNIDRLLEGLKDQESQSLEELYGPEKAQGANTRPQASEDQSSLHRQIWKNCDKLVSVRFALFAYKKNKNAKLLKKPSRSDVSNGHNLPVPPNM